ncbi:Planctomycete cytochrome C [Planctomycetes bacterium CA13]|uniref:Planctomycete cytochrome C n=2 Tax=Novipirellula herctigrandis TaxID=2527986 RepID=A0A5C5YYM5_9BACT|nr:Planctomycete cytochrome C [Planctomycetes bacterium CA13]
MLGMESFAEESVTAESEILFVRRIGPLLREKCLGCHGNDPDAIEGSLDVRSMSGLLAGGDSGEPSIVSGKFDDSPLYLAATRFSDDWSEMPPKESEQLTAEQLAWLRDWIASGAVWPDQTRRNEIESEYEKEWSVEDGTAVKTAGGLDVDWTNRKYDPAGLWAYQPVTRPSLPASPGSVEGKATVDPIDLLIEQALSDGIKVAPRADRRTLIRRATFDLTGLPPTPREVEAFLSDRSPDRAAFARVVDRLLDSPHYGERMAQHWLDVVRYADSSGFANDFERGNAWRYRDYVIRSFNDDKPYNEFIREQIAGDEIDPNDPGKVVATGFLRMGPWELTGMEVAKLARQRFLDDVTNSIGETFLGHSLQCARCHDHKFDPVPTRDYYSIQAVFATTQLVDRPAGFLPQENTDDFGEKAYLLQVKRQHSRTTEELNAVLVKNAENWWKENHGSSDAWQTAIEQAKHKGKGQLFTVAREILRKQGFTETQLPPKLECFTPEQFGKERVAVKGLQRLTWELDRYRPFALAVYNGHTPKMSSVTKPMRMPDDVSKGELESTCILNGGDPFAPGENVMPDTLSVIDEYVSAEIPDSIDGRRKAFADWVADPGNPLTTRVIVNRLWQWQFGRAIAGNPNNFGSTGARPTHPVLLDWLAATFVEDDWSIKTMNRRIVMSDAYCRSTQYKREPGMVEPESVEPESVEPESVEPGMDRDSLAHASRLYAVFKPRRLSAEELRDAMLKLTGELNSVVGGIPCRPEINQEVALQPRQVMGSFASAWVPNPQPERRNRRSIYVLKLRGLVDPLLEVFNSPSPDFSCERRESSTVTPQVFSLFNGQNTHTRALSLANRATNETENDHEALALCFRLALARSPTVDEMSGLLAHWDKMTELLPVNATPPDPQPLKVVREAVEENTGEQFVFEEELFSNRDYVPDRQASDCDRRTRALADVCLVILNSNEFVYLY